MPIYIIIEKITLLFQHKHKQFSLTLPDISGLGQYLEETNCFRHHIFSAPIDDIYGEKAVNVMLLEVLKGIEEPRKKKEKTFQGLSFDCDRDHV